MAEEKQEIEKTPMQQLLQQLKGGEALQIGSKASPLIQRMAQNLQWRNRQTQSETFQIELSSVNKTLCVNQRPTQSEIGTGVCVWDSAHVLIAYLEKLSLAGELSGVNRVIDLGSGTGVVALACALILHTQEIVLTDLEEMVDLMEENVKLFNENCELSSMEPAESTTKIDVIPLDWRHDPSPVKPPFDLILGCDVVYPRLFAFDPLLDLLPQLCHENSRIILAYDKRDSVRNVQQDFSRGCIERGLLMQVIPEEELDSRYVCDDIEIWQVQLDQPE